jgi:hypothetical protein
MKLRFKLILISTLFCLLSTLTAEAQPSPVDVNGDGTLNILVMGTSNSIEDNFEEFSPNQITTELQSILSLDPLISLNINVVSEDIYRTKTVSTGIAGQFTANRDYYCHSLTQYYYWPDNRTARINNLTGNNGTDWDYVVINADPYIISTMPGYFSLGVNKIGSVIHSGGAVPLLMMEWAKDSTFINHFEEFAYRTAEGATVPVQVIPAGLAWQSLPGNLRDVSSPHPTPNGAYLAAASIYSTLLKRSASSSQYNYNDTIADVAEYTRNTALGQVHFTGQPTFISPFKSCNISDTSLVYNHGGTSTENGILTGLQWVISGNQKTLQYGATAPVHLNYGRSSMGSTHLYRIDSTNFDYSFGYPLQDDASTGLVTMLYGLDKRLNATDVETDLGTARQMINQSELPYARNVPLRTIIAQMIEEIPGVLIYPIGDPWHLSSDVNKAIGTYMYTILTSDCTLPPAPNICSDATQWRSWMAHKVGQEIAWNLMYQQGANSCNKRIDNITACGSYTWINGTTYYSSNTSATFTYTNSAGCDSSVILNLTINPLDMSVTQNGSSLTANQAGANYQWLNCSTGASITGANNQSYTPATNGSYAVIVNYNGCSDTSSCISLNTVGLIDNIFESEILIYPNPTDENVSIQLGGYCDNVTLIVRNVYGNEMVSQNLQNTDVVNVKIEGAPGIYFLTISCHDKNATFKILKK